MHITTIIIAMLLVAAIEALNPYGFTKPVVYSGESVGEPLILTPLLRSGDLEEARSAALVNISGTGDVISYSGYFTVNEEYNSNLFFWFFPSRSNYEEDPVLIWLQGGPGSSSMLALFWENGPFYIEENQLFQREVSWDLNHSVLYVDSPVGTGFSFTDDYSGYATEQTQVGSDLYAALLQFFQLFPELQDNPFFVTGESYGGKYVPALSYTIHQNNPEAEQKINFQGLSIGNGMTDPIHQFNYSTFVYQLGIVDENTRDRMREYEEQAVSLILAEEWESAARTWDNIIYIYQDASEVNTYDYLLDYSYDWDFIGVFLNQPEIRRGIHVGETTYTVSSDLVYSYLEPDIPKSVASWVAELLSYYRVLIYNGQMDIISAYALALNYLQNLDFSAAEEYRSAGRRIWEYGGDIAGYIKTAGNLTEVLVRNSGHLVPTDQPEVAFDLITQFTRGTL